VKQRNQQCQNIAELTNASLVYIAHSVACITITFTPKAPELAFSFHELGDEASLPDLRLLIQQYFDIVDYVVSLYGHT
jgi:hypothetical protein